MPGKSDIAPIAVTMGEPAGIGGELTLMAWSRRATETIPFFAVDDAGRLRALAERIGLEVSVREIDSPAAAVACFDDALPVIHRPVSATVEPGAATPTTAESVLRSIEDSVRLALAGECAAVVTNPVQKKPLLDAGFKHQGHTDFLGELAGGGVKPVMMLACRELRVVPVTVHLPLASVPRLLDSDAIVHAGTVTSDALMRDFGIAAPRLVVAALNPHAGEQGTLGREELDIIIPAVERLKHEGISVLGPYAADSLFHPAARRTYDAALCMYHDQALIPLKTVDFEAGVNITLGLPFIRTSPDHGTALDIAGTGKANPASLLAALDMAAGMARNRLGGRGA